MNGGTTVIEAHGLGKRYGATWALRDCNLALPAGHLAALVGPNGAGKTTLLNLVAGLAVPTAGSVTVLGRPAGSRHDGCADRTTSVLIGRSIAKVLCRQSFRG